MKRAFVSFLLLIPSYLFAQTNTEVLLCEIKSESDGLTVFNFQNISQNDGYDSQPSFVGNEEIAFAANKEGQTDIAIYSISEKTKTWFNTPTPGGEYSPQSFPNTSSIAAVRLDTTGLQRLYRYDKDSSSTTELIEGVQVAYYSFYDEHAIVASVLSEDNLDLVIYKEKKKRTDTILTNVGRSIHKIPGSETMSYTSVNEEKNQDLYLLSMESRESFFVCQLPIGIQDYTWLNNSQILLGSGSKLYLYDTFLNSKWVGVADFSEHKIKNISRLAVSPDGSKLALVAEPVLE
jgi:Tol biopolymer transport system component